MDRCRYAALCTARCNKTIDKINLGTPPRNRVTPHRVAFAPACIGQAVQIGMQTRLYNRNARTITRGRQQPILRIHFYDSAHLKATGAPDGDSLSRGAYHQAT